MKKVTVFKVSLIIAIILNILGAYFKIAHYPYGSFILSVGLIAGLGFIIPGLIDVFRNDNSKPLEKLMWTVGFVFLSGIAGLLYFPKFKKRN